jgi:uncharacterized repeat protein (TIGR03803 family)
MYGTTSAGGSWSNGPVFAINLDGTGFTNLHNFAGSSTNSLGVYTNSDGAHPWSSLILSSNTLYGTTVIGGSTNDGTVFAVNTDGTGFTNLHNFTNSDGTHPYGALCILGKTLYGTAQNGGTSFNAGTVFAINTDGTGFTNLHRFLNSSDGGWPQGGLVLSHNTLCGTTCFGGNSSGGAVFAINTDGTGFTNLHRFAYSEGIHPYAALMLSGNTLYGTTYEGGSPGYGTVFSITLPAPPQLIITLSETNVILTWPTNVAGFDYSGFTLQSTTNLVSPAVWTTNSSEPVVVNGQNTVTNLISGTQQFYRLSQ